MCRRQTSLENARRAVSQTALVILTAVCIAMILSATVGVRMHESNDSPPPGLAPSQIDAMKANLQSPDAGMRLDAAVGLLHAGQLEGGRVLLDLAAGQDAAIGVVAAGRWARVGTPMAEAVGCVLAWPADGEAPTPEQLAAAREFWNRRATPTLLEDVLNRLAGTDRRWTRVQTMLAGRDWLYKVVGKWFNGL
jgi:hypothetical protein